MQLAGASANKGLQLMAFLADLSILLLVSLVLIIITTTGVISNGDYIYG